jgi:hypothetical protein
MSGHPRNLRGWTALRHRTGQRQKSESAWCEECAQLPAWLLPMRGPVLEALHVQRVASEDSDLNLHRIGGVILV